MRRILTIVVLATLALAIAFGARRYMSRDGRAEPGARDGVQAALPPESAALVSPDTAPGVMAGGPSAVVDTPPPQPGTRPGSPTKAPAQPSAGAPGRDAAPATPLPDADDADAQRILARASAAYAKVRSMRAEFVQELENPLLRTRTRSAGTLYQRRPDRFLMRFSEPAGDVIVSDGQHFWIYYPSVDAKQVIRAPASQASAGGVDLQAQFLGDPARRFAATINGKEVVSGRTVHILTLVPREPMGYQRLKVWVDAGDYLVRRFQIIEETGTTRLFDLRGLEVNPRLGDELFRFTPPAGARVVDRG